MYDQVGRNKRRSWLLVITFFLFTTLSCVAIAYGFGLGSPGIAIAVAIAGATAASSWWKSDAIALRVSRAQPADPVVYARYHNLVEGLCIASGLPKPRLYIVEDDAPNAFATGRNPQNAAIAVTSGLLAKLDRVELEGVLAHELAHIRNYDIAVQTLSVVMLGTLVLLGDLALRFAWFSPNRRSSRDVGPGPQAILALFGLVVIIVGPLIAQLFHFALSRRRETLADFSAVEMTRYPPGLISALEKLRADTTVVRSGSRATAHMWIEQPIDEHRETSKLSWLNKAFNTHPPLEERIAALREL